MKHDEYCKCGIVNDDTLRRLVTWSRHMNPSSPRDYSLSVYGFGIKNFNLYRTLTWYPLRGKSSIKLHNLFLS